MIASMEARRRWPPPCDSRPASGRHRRAAAQAEYKAGGVAAGISG